MASSIGVEAEIPWQSPVVVVVVVVGRPPWTLRSTRSRASLTN